MKKGIFLLLFVLLLWADSKADTKYVLVQSELNVRSRPSLGGEVHGRLYAGDRVEVEKTYHDWSFLTDIPSEETCGWVSSNYLVSSPVTEMNCQATINANGRVALRKSVNGDRKSWAHPGDILTVYGKSDTWSVTNRGYIKTEFLSFAP